ncbi:MULTISPECIES: NAD(P)/FAD-dependent oxidoreductase [unclassified Ruegeria]|uniref:NAD(P)/FAD-dependent oxidoreductase n=1 Tax=unclassified Ruegeria TaxID=2625375 RepID=UPI0014891E1F|nr:MULTISPECIES: FAD-dependent oxidoreductase [unclassified Ruegeria]NOD76212.1 FAD-dependent oxidoreductase [Ruegeria sp. HKCCD4332]NOD90169.1 FAD-dependent oxidoreductase [Ruegeria sp. HKCCD4318]NOE15242.1 FAD-dependent oxidoreductase [Ruegeria sp. HKCCD4318-2]NOG10548.1 FAD-dependent oxidoreductase [Ruegeria sp. HKCCD4315]
MFDETRGVRKKIAIVGAGISGLSAAYYLSENNDVTVYEAEPRLGGHARTVMAGKNGDQPVDTGFIVFNYATYPYLTQLFDELNVPVIKSEMSFGATIDNGRIEYGLNNLRTLTAQKRNLARPAYYKMIADILRFGKEAPEAAKDDDTTIGELVDQLRLGHWFRHNYLMPMCGAIWSTPVEFVDQFPARSLVQFFRNHALLASGRANQHQWYTVKGGSIEYVRRIDAALRARGCDIRLAAPVQHVHRDDMGVSVTSQGHTDQFDEIILATHSDQSLAILGEGATPAEAAALGAIRYQPNTAILHCDPRQMPKRRACWSSWTYRSQAGDVGVTYWMNRLQNIPDSDPLFVTLNASSEIPADKIYDQVEFAHPVFDKAALKAQGQIREMQGQNRTWFAGAYNRHGFHEDGIASAMHVVARINGTPQTIGADNGISGNDPAIPVAAE